MADQVLGERIGEDGACFRVGDHGFPQLFELLEGCKGELELLEVVERGHKLWGPKVPAEVMGKAVAGLDAIGNESWWDCHVGSQAMGEG